MKTAKEILKDTLLPCQFETLEYLNPDIYIEVLNAMKAYASSAIDECAESATTETLRSYHGTISTVVDKSTILKVKNKLK